MTDDPADRRPQLFISYASADVTRAQALHDRLVACGHRVWFGRLRLEPGRHWHSEIEAGRDASRLVRPNITPRWALLKRCRNRARRRLTFSSAAPPATWSEG